MKKSPSSFMVPVVRLNKYQDFVNCFLETFQISGFAMFIVT